MLPESPGYCREYFLTEVCFPHGLALPSELIFNFYILIKNRSNGGGLSGDTYFRREAGHAPSTTQSRHLRGSHGQGRARARDRRGVFPRSEAAGGDTHGRPSGVRSADERPASPTHSARAGPPTAPGGVSPSSAGWRAA